MAVDDNGNAFEPSPDPLLADVQPYVAGYQLGTEPDTDALRPLLSNAKIFGVDLYEAGLAEKVCSYFKELTAGKGAVRATLHKYTA
jgi:fructuronate reductase